MIIHIPELVRYVEIIKWLIFVFMKYISTAIGDKLVKLVSKMNIC